MRSTRSSWLASGAPYSTNVIDERSQLEPASHGACRASSVSWTVPASCVTNETPIAPSGRSSPSQQPISRWSICIVCAGTRLPSRLSPLEYGCAVPTPCAKCLKMTRNLPSSMSPVSLGSSIDATRNEQNVVSPSSTSGESGSIELEIVLRSWEERESRR